MSAIQEAIAKLTEGSETDEALAGAVAREILTGSATAAQIGAFLVALRIRGERPHHLLAFASVLREHALGVELGDGDVHPETLVDTCGTGGDAAGTFNISTTAGLIAAGAGARVAKHGNRAVTGRYGSADVLGSLGVKLEIPPLLVARCIREAGFGFLFAPVFHEAMRHAGPARLEIGVRTIFNMLGPLANPAGARRQVIGVYDGALGPVFAEVLKRLDSIHAMIVHGSDGLDEITPTGPTEVVELRGGEIRSWRVNPAEFGIAPCKAGDLFGGATAYENADIVRAILGGEKGPKRDAAELNAAAALVVADRAKDLAEGLALARAAIDSGAAAKTLEKLIEVSNQGL